MKEQHCEHCEQKQLVNEIGLCSACSSMECIRVLYERNRRWTPEWDAHLRRLAQRAKARLPLFEEPAKASGEGKSSVESKSA